MRMMDNILGSHLVHHLKEVKVVGHAQKTVVGVMIDYLLHAALVGLNPNAAAVPRALVHVIPGDANNSATGVAVLRVP